MFFTKKVDSKFALVGSGKVLCFFARRLIELNFPKPIIISWDRKKHKRDQLLLSGSSNFESIFDLAVEYEINLYEIESINSPESFEILKSENIDVVFSLSSRWIFSKELINLFSPNILNIHGGFLPHDRGSVVYSKILNNISYAGATIHQVTPDIDAGPIFLRKKKEISDKQPTITIHTNEMHRLCFELLDELLIKIINNEEIEEIHQEISEGVYMPQPYTELNGLINWDWKILYLERFLRAFGSPMPGAWTFFKNEKISITDYEIILSDISFHPFYYGRVVNVNNKKYAKVICNGGFVVIKSIFYRGKTSKAGAVLKVSDVLYSSEKELLDAKISSMRTLSMPLPLNYKNS